MIVLTYFICAFVALGILELMFITVMGLQRAQTEGKLTPWVIKSGTAFMYFGILWDVLCNVLIASVVFLEIPRELTVSARLRRLVMLPSGWRKSMATWFAVCLLNPFSNDGPHIPLPA